MSAIIWAILLALVTVTVCFIVKMLGKGLNYVDDKAELGVRIARLIVGITTLAIGAGLVFYGISSGGLIGGICLLIGGGFSANGVKACFTALFTPTSKIKSEMADRDY